MLFLLVSLIAFSQEVPKGYKELVRKAYNEGKDEIKMSFDEYYKLNVDARAKYIRFLKSVAQQKSVSDMCSNGTFESGDINTSDWKFFWYGGQSTGNGNGANSKKNSGSFSGSTNQYLPQNQVHHKVVSIGTDPTTASLSTVPSFPSGNTKSLRLGNKIPKWGKESVAKVVTITPNNATLSFSYATVLCNPSGHTNSQPYFKVWIYDANNTSFLINFMSDVNGQITNPGTGDYGYLVDLGGGSNMILATNPMLQNATSNGSIKYKDWSCVTADLSSLIGKTVVIVFENRDCYAGAHWGYSYLDNICLGCDDAPNDEGSVSINQGQTTKCDIPGKICVDYTLPVNPNNNQTGTGVLSLEIIQNGSVVTTLSSPTLSTGSTYCFNLTSGNLSGINNALLGFDYRVKGQFNLGSFAFAPQIIGSSVNGVQAGQNNDYQIKCPPTPGEPCKSCMDQKAGVLSQTQYPVAVQNPVNSQIMEAIEDFKAYSGNIPITEIRISVTDFSYDFNYKECQSCSKDAGKWGNIYTTTNNINGLVREQQAYENSNVNATGYQQYGAVREIVWKSATGVLFPNGQSSLFNIHYILPPLDDIPCCAVDAKYCVKITIKDANCCYKEIYSCSTIKLHGKK